MNKIVISGYYGFNNIGDESILTAIITNIRDNVEDIEITVLSKDPDLTRKKHGVKAVDRKNIFQISKAIRESDLLISGGGSLLQDVTSRRNVIYYLAIMVIGFFYKKKVMVYSQGIGPINSGFNKLITRRVLDRVDYISLRDKKSLKVLRDMNVKNENIIVTADPVIGLKMKDLDLGLNLLHSAGKLDESKKTVAFALRGRDRDKNLVDVIARVADELVKTLDVNIVFIPFHYGEDRKIITEIQEKMDMDSIFLDGKYEILEMLSIVGNLDLLVGIRLHSLIFSAVMNTPMVGISYDPKIENFLASIGEEVLCKLEDVSYQQLLGETVDKLTKEEEYKEKLSTNVDELKTRLSKNEEIIKILLREARQENG